MKTDALVQLETISESHEVDKIEEYIDYLESEIDNFKDYNESLKDEINDLRDEIQDNEDKVSFKYPDNFNRNIFSDLILEKLFENLSLIPLNKIERLTDEYTK